MLQSATGVCVHGTLRGSGLRTVEGTNYHKMYFFTVFLHDNLHMSEKSGIFAHFISRSQHITNGIRYESIA